MSYVTSSLFVKQPTGRYREATMSEICETAAAYMRANPPATLRSPKDTEDYLMKALHGLESEHFYVLFLDNRHRVIACESLFNGTVDGTSVYPREVVKRTLEHNAAAIVVAHNHPSGVAEPSQADERITQRLKSALNLIDVRLLDSIIVGRDRTTSLAARGIV